MPEERITTQAVWSAAAVRHSYPGLAADIEVDVAIVGAGITGLSTAYMLSKAGKKVAVLEAFEPGMGTTGSSTGNLYAPIDEYLSSIKTKHNEESMRQVAQSRMAAIEFIRDRVAEYNIDCDFEEVPFYLFTTPDTRSMNKVIKEERLAAIKAGLVVSSKAPEGFPYQVEEFMSVAQQAQFNPLAYVQQLAVAIQSLNCEIFVNTRVTGVDHGSPCTVHTTGGKVKAQKVVMATHSPKGIYGVHTAMEPYREYALAVRLQGALPDPGIYWHVQPGPHYSVRPYRTEEGNFLLVLGEPHKVGNKTHNDENIKKVEQYLRANFKVDSITYTWGAQNYKGADNLPYIGTSPLEKNIYIATGFAADGLVYGTLAGMIISDDIMGQQNEWAKLYDPRRFTPLASAGKFAKENATVAANLLKDYLFYGEAKALKDIHPGEGKTVKLDGERLAGYRDQEGKLHLVSAVCPHMGCLVHWNRAEKSWDCPCHGSRFGIDGKVLEGPAFHDLAKPKGSRNKDKSAEG